MRLWVLGGDFSQFFGEQTFQRFFDGQMAHENSIKIAATGEHGIGCPHIVIRLFEPFAVLFTHGWSLF